MAIGTTAAILGAAALGAGATIYGVTQQKKVQEKAISAAQESEQVARDEQARLEEKYGVLTPEEKEREARTYTLEKEREAALRERAGKTGEELLGEAGPNTRKLLDLIGSRVGMTGEELLREVGPDTRALLDKISRRATMPGEELYREEGPTAVAVAEQILAEAKEPGKFYESTLAEELELARQMVNQEANRRGVFGGLPEGGIRFEMLGRTGIDLAIKSAKERTLQRQQALQNATNLINQYVSLAERARAEQDIQSLRGLTEQAGTRAEQGEVSERAISEKGQARTELENFLVNLQNLSETAKARTTGAATGAAQIAAGQIAPAQQAVQNIYGLQAGQAGTIGAQGAELLGEVIQKIPTKETTQTTLLPGSSTITPPTSTIPFSELIKIPGRTPSKTLEELSGASILEWQRPKRNLILS